MNASRSARTARTLLFVAWGCGAAGFLLRLLVLLCCTDERRLLNTGSLGLVWLVLFAVAVAAGVLALTLRLPRVKKGADYSFGVRPNDLTVAAGAAALMLFGALFGFLKSSETAERYSCFGAALSAVLLFAAALLRDRGRPVSFWLVFPVSVWAAVRLILDFKDWSFDPRVIDFCCRLFADVSALLAAHFLSGYTLKVGRLRASVLWSLLAPVFALMSVPDFLLGWGGTLGGCLSSLGLALLLFLQAKQLLKLPPEPAPPLAESDQAPDQAPEAPDQAPEAPIEEEAQAPEAPIEKSIAPEAATEEPVGSDPQITPPVEW